MVKLRCYFYTVILSVFVNSLEVSSCGQIFSGSLTNGSFTSPGWPNPYPVNQDCEWIIITPPGSYIKLNITDFELQVGSCTDILTVERVNEDRFDGCGGRVSTPVVFYSYGNITRIKFKSDNDHLSPENGFRAEFHVLKAACPPSHLSGLSGTITSPNFPDFYPVNINCTYNITVPQGSRVELDFSVADLQYHSNCSKDSIIVLVHENSGFMICGKPTLPLPYMASQENTIIVILKSDGSETHRGFKAQYKAVAKATPTTSAIQPTSIVSVLPTNTPAPEIHDQFSSSFVPVPNRSLSGHILNKLNTGSNIACVMLCQRNTLCKSVTYKTSLQSTGICILHSIEGTPYELSEKNNAVYYRLVP